MTDSTAAESVHLYNLAHTVPFTPINAFLNNRFLAHTFEHSLPQPDAAINKFCPQCSALWIPGISLSQRIIYRKKHKVRRVLRSRCLQCKFNKYDESLLQEKAKIEPRQGKKKKKSLSAMLDQKREKKEDKGLDLMEFMKS